MRELERLAAENNEARGRSMEYCCLLLRFAAAQCDLNRVARRLSDVDRTCGGDDGEERR